jgi:hypothetical protein
MEEFWIGLVTSLVGGFMIFAFHDELCLKFGAWDDETNKDKGHYIK